MTNTIKTVEELRANIKANNCVARDIELEVTHSKLVEVFTKLLTRATKEVIRDYIESECFAENDFNYITTSAVKYRQTLKSEIIKVLAWKLANKVMDMREQEAKKPVNMVIETTEDLRDALDSATTIEQVSELLHAVKISFLKSYIKEEGYYYGKPLNKVTKIEMIDTLMRVYSDRLEENEKPEAEAEPTLEELEQETGFTFCRRLGQEFLSGEVSLEQLNSQIESLERSMKYGDNSGSLHGLAYTFGIAIEGKSCEELLSEIEEFIKSKEFEALSPVDKQNRIHEIKIEERRAMSGHSNLQAEINEVREKWKAVQTALRTFNPKENRHLAGLKMLAEELRQRYFDLRLESLRFYLRMKAISKAI